MSELNIYQRINKIMEQKLYVKKGSAGQGTGVGYDDLIAQLSPFLTQYGIVVTAERVGESKSRETTKGSYIYEAEFNIHYINIDNPDDRFTTRIEAHAMDAGDKAPGKAITYATKTSMLKVFSVESGDGEESRHIDAMLEAKKKTMSRQDLTKYIQDSGFTVDQVVIAMNGVTGEDKAFAKMPIKDVYDAVTQWKAQ